MSVADDPQALEEAVEEVVHPTAPRGRRRALFNVLRACVGVGLAVYLISVVISRQKVDLWAQTAASIKWLLLIALSIQLVSILITTVRWQWLLRVQQIEVSLHDLLSLTMVGMFFSSVLPGAVGGDVLKMVYIARHAPNRRTEAVLTIMVDRVLGLLGLLLVALVSVLFSLDFILNANRQVQLATITVAMGSAAGIAGVLAVLFRRHLTGLPLVSGLIAFGRLRLPAGVVHILDRLVRALDLYKGAPRVIAAALAISAFTHVLAALTVFLIGRAYHETHLGLWSYFLAAQIANTVAAIPITPAGFGGRDLVLSTFFLAGGATPAEAGVIPVFNTFIILFWSLIGGVFFIFMRHPRKSG